VNPITNFITHIDIKSQLERQTINRAELAAIAVAHKQENTAEHMSILTDNSFCINTIRNYAFDPAAYNQHLHKDLLQLANQLLKDRDSKQQKNAHRESQIAYGCGIQ
jgi:ribonuclease HI